MAPVGSRDGLTVRRALLQMAEKYGLGSDTLRAYFNVDGAYVLARFKVPELTALYRSAADPVGVSASCCSGRFCYSRSRNPRTGDDAPRDSSRSSTGSRVMDNKLLPSSLWARRSTALPARLGAPDSEIPTLFPCGSPVSGRRGSQWRLAGRERPRSLHPLHGLRHLHPGRRFVHASLPAAC